jgi:Flp pilus assembly protein TadG
MEGQRGASMAESAIAMVLTLMVLFGIIYAGMLLFTYQLVTNGARLGSRYAMVHGADCTSPCVTADASAIQDYVRAQTQGLDSASLSVSTQWSTAAGPSSACAAGGSNAAGNLVCVTVTYPFKFTLPLLPSPTLTVSSTSKMVISQ